MDTVPRLVAARFLYGDAATSGRRPYSVHEEAGETVMLVHIGLRPLWPVILFVPWFFLSLALLLWPARTRNR
jgi:hypothetical protein